MALGVALGGSGGGGGSAITLKDEGSTLTAGLTSLDVVGLGGKATVVGTAGTLTIPVLTGPEIPPASPSGSDDEFTSTQSGSVVTPTGWTGVNWSALNVSDVNFTKPDALYVENPANGAGVNLQRHILKALPAGDFTIVCGLLQVGKTLTAAGSVIAGLSLTDGTTNGAGNQIICTLAFDNTVAAKRVATRYTNFTGGAAATVLNETGEPTDRYVRIRRSGTNYGYAWSPDLRTWYEPVALGALSFTPSHMGLMVRNDNTGAVQRASFDFFRYAASATAKFGWGEP